MCIPGGPVRAWPMRAQEGPAQARPTWALVGGALAGLPGPYGRGPDDVSQSLNCRSRSFPL